MAAKSTSCITDPCAEKTQEVDSATTFPVNLPLTESRILECLEDNRYLIRPGGKAYKIPVNDQSTDFVVVKKISLINYKKNIVPEVEILKNINPHPNIVTLKDYMVSTRKHEKSMFLVYEYLESGISLDCLLINKDQQTPGENPRPMLDWPKRLNIAIGVAQALSYMHHDCSPPVVHLDVKSSNILIDGAFNAKLAKFGSARFLEKYDRFTGTSTGLSRSNPAYIHAKDNRLEEADVYKLGMILLELVTGKVATDEIAQRAREYQAAKIKPADNGFDKDIIVVKEWLSEMSKVFDVAVSCINKSGPKRPDMKQVLKWLLKCSTTPPVPAAAAAAVINGVGSQENGPTEIRKSSSSSSKSVN